MRRKPAPAPVVVYEPAAARRRARPRRGRRRGGNLMGTLANGAMSLLGKGISTLITGFGDYKVEGNSLMTGGIDPPTVVNSVNNGGVIIRHREYLQDIDASTPFSLLTLPINPGQISTFPWLSSIAAHFEQYKFRGLLFEFKSLSSDSVLSTATSSALGSIVMATQYNALSPPFPNKFVMENYEFANSSKPSISFIHPVECKRTDTTIVELYTRTGAPQVNSDLRLYDLGNFSIAAVGMQATSGVAGELWCTYEVEFLKPKIENPTNATDLIDHFHLPAGTLGATPFFNAFVDPTSTLNGTHGNNTYFFPEFISEGRFMLLLEINGTAGVVAAGVRTLINCTPVNLFSGNSQSRLTTVGTTSDFFDWVCVDVTAINASVVYTGMIFPIPTVFGDYFVTAVPGNLNKLPILLPPLVDRMVREQPIEDEDLFGDDDPYQDDEQYFRAMIRDIMRDTRNLKISPE